MLIVVRDSNFIIVFIISFMSVFSISCVQTQNSSVRDEISYATLGITSILATNCSGCHPDYHTQTSNQLIANGLVVAGNPENSKLYYRLTGSLGSNGPKNMPMGSSLTADDVAQVREWIQGL